LNRTHKYILGTQSFANSDSGAVIVRTSTDGEVLDYVAISGEMLISSWEFQFTIEDQLQSLESDKPLYPIYDNASRSFIAVLHGRFLVFTETNVSKPGVMETSPLTRPRLDTNYFPTERDSQFHDLMTADSV
jgi:hypothetical protein